MSATPAQTLINNTNCYACYGVSLPQLLKLGELSTIASKAAAAGPVGDPIGFSVLADASTLSGVAITLVTASITPPANGLLLCFCFATANDFVTSVVGNGLTWVKCAERDATRNVSVWRAMGAAPTPGTVTITWGAGSPCGLAAHIQVYTNVKQGGTSGNVAFRQWVWSDTNAVTASAINPGGFNATVGCSVEAVNPCTGSAEAGWTQDLKLGQTGTGTQLGAFVAHKLLSTDASWASSMAGACNSILLEVISANSTEVVISPFSLIGLQIWNKSDTGLFQDAAKTSPCTDGTQVNTWVNGGNVGLGQDFVQAVAGRQPVFNTAGGANGISRVTFTQDMLRLISGNFAQPITVALVVKWTSTSLLDGPWFWDDGANFQVTTLATYGNDDTNYFAGITRRTNIPLGGVPGLLFVTFDNAGTSGGFYVNSLIGNLFGAGAGGITTAVTIGGFSGLTNFVDADYYEVMMFSRALTQIERAQISIYAKNRYALKY